MQSDVGPVAAAEAAAAGMTAFTVERGHTDDGRPAVVVVWLWPRQATALWVSWCTREPLVNVLGIVARLEQDRAARN